MTHYNTRMIEWLEARWLDPDCIETYRDDEEAWNRADEEYAERGIYDEQGISQA